VGGSWSWEQAEGERKRRGGGGGGGGGGEMKILFVRNYCRYLFNRGGPAQISKTDLNKRRRPDSGRKKNTNTNQNTNTNTNKNKNKNTTRTSTHLKNGDAQAPPISRELVRQVLRYLGKVTVSNGRVEWQLVKIMDRRAPQTHRRNTGGTSSKHMSHAVGGTR